MNNVVVNTSPFKKDIVTAYISEKTPISEIFTGLTKEQSSYFEVELNGELVKAENYDTTFVNDKDILHIYTRPHGGGGGKDRSLAMIAVAIAAAAATSGVAGALLKTSWAVTNAGTLTVGGNLLASSAGMAIGMLGGLLVNELLPMEIPNTRTGSGAGGNEQQSLKISKNSPAPYSPLPKLYGTRSIKPKYASSPQISLNANSQYITFTYFLNFGAVKFNGEIIGYDPYTDDTINGGHRWIGYARDYQNTEYRDISTINPTAVTIGETPLNELTVDKLVIGDPLSVFAQTTQRDHEVEDVNIDLLSVFSYVQTVEEAEREMNKISEKAYIIQPQSEQGTYPTKLNLKLAGDCEFRLYVKTVNSPDAWAEVIPNKDKHKYVKSRSIPTIVEATTDVDYTTYELSGYTDVNVFYVEKDKTILLPNIGADADDSGIKELKFVFIPHYWADENGIQTRYTQKVRFEEYTGYFKDTTQNITRTTPLNTTEIDVHIYADRGLYSLDAKSNSSTVSYTYAIYIKGSSSNTWVEKATLTLEGDSKNPIRKNAVITGLPPDQYYVQVRLKETSGEDVYTMGMCTWAFLQSFQEVASRLNSPYADTLLNNAYQLWAPTYDKKVRRYPVLAALTIKASDQFSGTIDDVIFNITGLVKNPITNVWEDEGNPAWVFYDALVAPQVIKPVNSANINLEEIAEWAAWCNNVAPNAPKMRINAYFTEKETLWLRLGKIAKTGLAVPAISDNQITIIRDKQGQIPVQVITPRNSNGLRVTKSFGNIPHAIKYGYTNPTTWETDYVIVYNTGYDKDTSNGLLQATDFLELSDLNITNIEQAKILARYTLAEMSFRAETFTVDMFAENLRAERGDVVIFAYDTVKIGETYGRVKSLIRSGNYIIGVSVDEPVVLGVNKKILIRFVHNNSVYTLTRSVNQNISTNSDIYFNTGEAINSNDYPYLSDGALFIYGDAETLKIDTKIRNVEYSSDLNATLTLVNKADELHATYTGVIPFYKPIIDNYVDIYNTIPSAPTIINIEPYIEKTPETARQGLLVGFEVPKSVFNFKAIVVELYKDYYKVASNTIPYAANTHSIAVFPVEKDTVYTVKLFLITENNVNSKPALQDINTTNYSFAPDIPETVSFSQESDSKIKISWDNIIHKALVGYKLYRNDGINRVAEYETTNSFYVLDEFFTSDLFSVAVVYSIDGKTFITDESDLFRCPYYDEAAMPDTPVDPVVKIKKDENNNIHEISVSLEYPNASGIVPDGLAVMMAKNPYANKIGIIDDISTGSENMLVLDFEHLYGLGSYFDYLQEDGVTVKPEFAVNWISIDRLIGEYNSYTIESTGENIGAATVLEVSSDAWVNEPNMHGFTLLEQDVGNYYCTLLRRQDNQWISLGDKFLQAVLFEYNEETGKYRLILNNKYTSFPNSLNNIGIGFYVLSYNDPRPTHAFAAGFESFKLGFLYQPNTGDYEIVEVGDIGVYNNTYVFRNVRRAAEGGTDTIDFAKGYCDLYYYPAPGKKTMTTLINASDFIYNPNTRRFTANVSLNYSLPAGDHAAFTCCTYKIMKEQKEYTVPYIRSYIVPCTYGGEYA